MANQKRKLFGNDDGVKRGGRPAEQVAKPNKKQNSRGVAK